jgi:hypothetical protein
VLERIFPLVLLVATWVLPTAAAATKSTPMLVAVLVPVAPDAQGLISSVKVSETLDVVSVKTGSPLLRLPLVVSNVQTAAAALTDLTALDTAGPLLLKASDEPRGARSVYRCWSANRTVHGPITLSYRVPITNLPNPLGAAPPLELRSEGGGFSGVSGVFILLPDSAVPYHFMLRWDLGAVPGGIGVSTLGVGDVRTAGAMTPKALEDIFVMGGHIHTFPAAPGHAGFLAAWAGEPPFDATAAMRWTQTLYGHYLQFFRAPSDNAYDVFLRRNPINPGGGIEVGHSFVGTFGEHTDVEDLKFTLAHEMVHTFVGGLDGESEALAWFSEGLAVYYERALPLRAGLITADAFLRDLNTTAGRYYTDALNQTPNDEIDKHFWADTRIRVLPYDRGSLYFAAVDEQVHRQSHEQRSLDDLVLSMLERRRAGRPMDENAWIETLRQELGAEGEADFTAMMAGRLVVPPTDSFGPCFARTTAPLRRYVLGFDSAVLIEPRRIVRGLQPESAAAAAGLRDGDEIVKPIPQDAIQADQTALLHLQIRRSGELLELAYLPRGETVQAYQWERSGGCKTPQPALN